VTSAIQIRAASLTFCGAFKYLACGCFSSEIIFRRALIAFLWVRLTVLAIPQTREAHVVISHVVALKTTLARKFRRVQTLLARFMTAL
jgi:hypothetical protein